MAPVSGNLPAETGHAANGAGAAAAPDAVSLGLADFEALMQGHHHHRHHRLPNAGPPRRLFKAIRAQAAAQPEDAGEAAEAAASLSTAAGDLLEALSDGGDGSQEERLAAQYDPLQRHALMTAARGLIKDKTKGEDGEDGAIDERRVRLDAMIADLEAAHGPALARGGEQARRFQSTVDAIERDGGADGAHAASPALRRLYGGGDGKTDAPLAPAALLAALLKRADGAGLAAALDEAQNKIGAGLRRQGGKGPRLWLSLADAASFHLVQTAFSMAAGLRRAVSERAGAAPRADQAGLAMELLRLGEPGGGNAAALVRQAGASGAMTPRQSGQVCLLVREAVRDCPDALWQADATARRADLLDQLLLMQIEHDAAQARVAPAPGVALETQLRRQQPAPGAPWEH